VFSKSSGNRPTSARLRLKPGERREVTSEIAASVPSKALEIRIEARHPVGERAGPEPAA